MGLYHSPRSVTSDLIFYADPFNPKSYSGSGSSMYDISGYNSTVTLYNTPTYTAPYLTYNGTTQYAQSANIPITPTAITVGVWCRILATPSNFNSPLGGTSTSCVILNNQGSVNQMGALVIINSANNFSTYYTYSLNTWYNFGFTWSNGDNIRFYVNGVQTNTSASTISGTLSSPTAFRFGSYSSQYLNGNIGPGYAYNRALTATEMLQNFNALRGRFGI